MTPLSCRGIQLLLFPYTFAPLAIRPQWKGGQEKITWISQQKYLLDAFFFFFFSKKDCPDVFSHPPCKKHTPDLLDTRQRKRTHTQDNHSLELIRTREHSTRTLCARDISLHHHVSSRRVRCNNPKVYSMPTTININIRMLPCFIKFSQPQPGQAQVERRDREGSAPPVVRPCCPFQEP